VREWGARSTPVLTRGFGSTLCCRSVWAGKLFTGNMTVVRERNGLPVCFIVWEKLTIRSERLFESASYDIA
jgi:hypothetical protein